MTIRSPRLQPGKFLIGGAKRLLQQNLPGADLTTGNAPRRSRSLGDVCAFAWQGPLPAVADSAGSLTAKPKAAQLDCFIDFKAGIPPLGARHRVSVAIRGYRESTSLATEA
jgi:hypothetical protein